MKVFCKFLIVSFLCLWNNSASAFAPEEHLPELQEQRARELFLQVKCPVCQGQVIESSDAEIAFQLRKLIRAEISSGKSDEEIKANLVTKYGDDILNLPPINQKNFLLWFMPIIFTVLGILFIRKIHSS